MADFLQIDVECLYLSHRQVVGQNETVDLLQVGPIAHNDLQAEFRQNLFISVGKSVCSISSLKYVKNLTSDRIEFCSY